MTPEARVRRVVDAAREVARAPGIVATLAAATGLSPEGVALALERHLELQPSDDEVRALVASAPAAGEVYVLLSSTVFVGALRAIAWAWAGAPRVAVRPSRREGAFASALVAAVGDAALRLAPELDLARLSPASGAVREVHVYGRAETIAHLRAIAPRGVRVRGHGPGLGVAVVGAGDALEDAAHALADDVVPFDQRGCLSPRVAFVEDTAEHAPSDEDPLRATHARAFAGALAAALADAERRVPRGAIAEEERAEAARFGQAMEFSGVLHRGGASMIGVSYNLMIPPPGRHVLVVPFDTSAALEARARPIAPLVTTVGATPRAPSLALPHARRAALGAMQRPPLDGPVDRRPE